MKMVPNTDSEFMELPHIVFTSEATWDPRILDHSLTDKDDWYNTVKELDDGLIETPFDEYGNYRKREVPQSFARLPSIHEEVEVNHLEYSSTTRNLPAIPPQFRSSTVSLRDTFEQVSNMNQAYVCYKADITIDEAHRVFDKDIAGDTDDETIEVNSRKPITVKEKTT